MKSRIALLATVLFLASTAHAVNGDGSAKSLHFDDTGCIQNLAVKAGQNYIGSNRSPEALLTVFGNIGFDVRTVGSSWLPVETRRDDSGRTFRFAHLKKGNFVLYITQSGTAERICISTAD